MDNLSREADWQSRKDLGGLVAITVFVITEIIFAIRYDWGLVLGFLPALAIAGAFGWISFRFIWVGVAIIALLEFVQLLSM